MLNPSTVMRFGSIIMLKKIVWRAILCIIYIWGTLESKGEGR